MFFEFINIVIFAVLLYLGYLLFFNPKENFSACGCTDNINENNEKTKLVNDHLTFVFQRQIQKKCLKKFGGLYHENLQKIKTRINTRAECI